MNSVLTITAARSISDRTASLGRKGVRRSTAVKTLMVVVAPRGARSRERRSQVSHRPQGLCVPETRGVFPASKPVTWLKRGQRSGVLADAGRLGHGLLDRAVGSLGQVPRRLPRADHYERGRGGADPAVAGKMGRGRACRSKWRSHCPARRRHRGVEPELVRTQHWAIRHRGPALGPTPGPSISGGDPRRVRQRPRRGVRGQVHAALVVLRRGRGRKAYGPASAQYVGDQRPVGSALDHHRRGQMDRDDHTRRRALSALSGHGGAAVLAVRSDRRDAAPPMASSRLGHGSTQFAWST